MATRLILQGLTDGNHLDEVCEVLSLDQAQLVIVSVAFVRSSGVAPLSDALQKVSKKTKVFAGIRNGITSAQAIKALLDLGLEVWLVDTGSAQLLYHPKLYYAHSDTAARVLVGSANLTSGGLNSNIEASVYMALDRASDNDEAVVADLLSVFEELTKAYPANVKRLDPKTDLETLLADPRLADERIATRPVGSTKADGKTFSTPLMKTKRKHSLAKPKKAGVVPKGLKKPVVPKAKLVKSELAKVADIEAKVAAAADSGAPLQYVEVWKTEGLTTRDLNVSTEDNTNAPGSMNLDQGDLGGDYEWAWYFRDVVFKDLDWEAPNARKIEVGVGRFRVVIEGVDCGEFDLNVRHDTKTDTTSYKQRNAMTRLSWGDAKEIVGRPELVGRTLTLSKAAGHPDRFLIEID